jgi:RNA polymerase sigma-B factor
MVRHTPSPQESADSRDRLVEQHLPLAYRLAARYRGRGIPLDDIRQVAALGLVKAAAGYVDEPGRNFHNYAIPTINGELRRHFRDRGWWIRPPRSLQEAQASVRAAEEALTSELHRKPSDAEIAQVTDVGVKSVRESRTLAACYSPRSLDTAPDAFGATPLDLLGDADPGVDATEWRICLEKAMSTLSVRDRRIIALRFVEERTQAEIGAELNITQMQVSRLLTRILASLRATFEEQELKSATSPSAA